jgi:hypothetical protein
VHAIAQGYACFFIRDYKRNLEPRQLERYDELDEISRAIEKSTPSAFPPAQF